MGLGNTLMSLMVKLGVDTGELDQGLADAEGKSQTAASNVGSNLSNIGQSMQKTGVVMSAAVTAPIIGLGTVAVKSASDLEESMNAVNVVFEDATKSIEDYGETAAYTVGLSQSEFNQLATVTGAFLRNVGFDMQGAADETIILAERAADMASVFNTDVSQALGAIQSGLKGEFNPLEQYGVKINAAAIETQAFAMGLADAEGKINDSAKAQAALALIMEQTQVTAGDFQATSDGMANSLRIQQAALTDLASDFGNVLMPLMIEFLQAVNPIIKSFGEMDPAVRKNIVVILGLVAALGPVITTIGTIVSAIGSLITFFGAGGTAATAFASIGTFLSGTVLPAVTAAIAAISLPVIALIAALGALVLAIKVFGKDAWNTMTMIREIIFAVVQQIIWKLESWGGAFAGIGRAIQGVLGWIAKLQNKLFNLSIPDWLTPGSPTPLENGLVGIASAMKKVNRIDLMPELNQNIGVSAASTSAIPSVAARQETQQSQQQSFDYNKLSRSIVTAMQTTGVV